MGYKKSAGSVKFLLDGVVRSKLLNVMPYVFKNTLTVLNYHRIDDPYRNGFDTLKINVSATPVDFEKQMEYVGRHFNVITCRHLALYLNGEIDLPPRAAIITFDDGYYDNLSNAYPVLKAKNLSAVIFLTTGFIGTAKPFYWDYVACCFFNTKKDSADLPVLGFRSWSDPDSKDAVLREWVDAVKRIPELEKQRAVDKMEGVLDVVVSNTAFSGLHLTWDQVRDLDRNGIEFGAHTVNHPILTRVPLDQARNEISHSKTRIEEEIGKKVISFAYPNGGADDFSIDIMDAVKSAGIPVAFSLMPGPVSYKTVRQQPLAIRRIFLSHRDNYSRFVFKVTGVKRLIGKLRG